MVAQILTGRESHVFLKDPGKIGRVFKTQRICDVGYGRRAALKHLFCLFHPLYGLVFFGTEPGVLLEEAAKTGFAHMAHGSNLGHIQFILNIFLQIQNPLCDRTVFFRKNVLGMKCMAYFIEQLIDMCL